MTESRFTITWRAGAYYVSIPNYQGGEVVRAEIADDLLAALTNLLECIDLAARNGETILPFAGYGQVHLEKARAAVAKAEPAAGPLMCPAGGWTGMPADMVPTVENCVKYGNCGCDLRPAAGGST